ncbi:HNH endonuclease [Salmonella enterica]|nr:HNH endonuclease [Salmonella enterica]ECL7002075.1 HNH endonuclease [Salmonella enterica]EEG1917611.1 HNH endonuclease [Salmonella enterica]EEG5133661.1 HNH endonuclease [Salmonella enterica]EFT6635086.1 HNH endonuclease [Salmonella enterica]
MFNITRTYPAPDCIARNRYNDTEVTEVLKPLFHAKCYLCERNEVQDAEVEHLIPHEGDDNLKYNWDNLFYSCSRCNGIKSNRHKNILNCSDSSIDIFNQIICKMPSMPDDDVVVLPNINPPNLSIANTVGLLNECYNLKNTGLRKISRESLIEQMFFYYSRFIEARMTLKDPSKGHSRKSDAKEILEAMLKVEHPFSIFWRWHYLGDTFLTANYPDLRDGF